MPLLAANCREHQELLHLVVGHHHDLLRLSHRTEVRWKCNRRAVAIPWRERWQRLLRIAGFFWNFRHALEVRFRLDFGTPERPAALKAFRFFFFAGLGIHIFFIKLNELDTFLPKALVEATLDNIACISVLLK